MNDIFHYIENSDLCNYADDSIHYIYGKSLSVVIENLKADFLKMSRWFHKNFMVLNPDKCHFMVLGGSNCTFIFTRNGTTIESSKEEKVLDITIIDKLTSTSHLGNNYNQESKPKASCSKQSKLLHGL